MKAPTTAIIIIGNEILSGRTQDTNMQWIAERLSARGIDMREARIIPDEKAVIVDSINDLRGKVDYLFTTGGIGPTHDDITTECVADAFGVPVEVNQAALSVMEAHDGQGAVKGARLKMAMIPRGARLIPNPVSAAPGYIMENVYVMAGVPRILQAMLDHVLAGLRGGEPFQSNTVVCRLFESDIAHDFALLQEKYSAISMGSYPHFHGGNIGLALVLRGRDKDMMDKATEELLQIIRKLGDEPRAVSLKQVDNS